MHDGMTIVGLTLLAGLAMPVGAAIAVVEKIRPDWLEAEFRHSVIAFGGGALLSAIALVLVPEGISNLTPLTAGFCFASGGIAFLGLDLYLAARNSPAGQMAAMLSDFIPEALALGATFASGSSSGPLLAMLMALQNIPEGFNASRELTASTAFSARRIIVAFSAMALAGPVAGLAGYAWLSDFPAAVSGIMLFAAGGILYLIFQDIAPQVKLERHWAPPLGAVAGFLLGLLGQMVIAT
jgi:ZIP family zinc transporter